MIPDADSGGQALSERHFFLVESPERGAARLTPEDQEHALRVLRLRPGDQIVGLDGCGRAWPLEVEAAEKRSLALRVSGAEHFEPRPGEPGSSLPWIEVALPLPKPARQQDMLERLTQLGVSRIVPLVTERTTQTARTLSANRLEKLRRMTREACKQSRRLWTVELSEPQSLDAVFEAAPGALVRLDAEGSSSLVEWSQGLSSAPRPTLLIGPEGGFTFAEKERIDGRGATVCRLTPTILRIETAAELAVGTLVQTLSGRLHSAD